MITKTTTCDARNYRNHPSPKISDAHRDRLAIVYVRQSTAAQVLEHRESTEMQYNLRHRAIDLGWRSDRVIVIDSDQGQSGASAADRLGFQQLLAEVSLSHVGVVLGIEMSRLARSNKDWHQLLELCAIFQTLLADQDGVYDPVDYNDRLLLGLKGTMSEAELHILRNRLQLGKRNKAARGELFAHPPRGFVKSLSGQITLDPDEAVRTTIQLCFDKFETLRSGRALLKWLRDNNIRLPVRLSKGPHRGELRWNRADHGAIYELLHHPFYAGAYCYGRTRLKPGGNGRREAVPQEDWQVLKKDHLPPYISWDQYISNVKQLAANAFRSTTLGAPRNGQALLGGIIKCGICGRCMSVVYSDRRNEGRYVCYAKGPGGRCQSLQAREVDQLITQQILTALEPASIDLSLATIGEMEAERARLEKQWQHQLERARYEVDRAQRQYQAVEPENRLVARELESNWENALRQQQQLEEEFARARQQLLATMTERDRGAIASLSSDIPSLWQATSTAQEQRKSVIRHLIKEVSINIHQNSELVSLSITWEGGFESHHDFRRSVQNYNQMLDVDRLRLRLSELRRAGFSARAIAHELNEEGFRTARGKEFRTITVQTLLFRSDMTADKAQSKDQQLPNDNRWSIPQLVENLSIPTTTLCHWCRRRWVQCSKSHSNRWIIWADADELRRLQRLCSYKRPRKQDDYPAELTTPKPLPVVADG